MLNDFIFVKHIGDAMWDYNFEIRNGDKTSEKKLMCA